MSGPGGTATLEGCLADPGGTYLGTVDWDGGGHIRVLSGRLADLAGAGEHAASRGDVRDEMRALPAGNKSGVKFHDLNGNGVQDGASRG